MRAADARWPDHRFSAATQPMHTHTILERVGLRPTYPRILALDFFRANPHDHFSAEQIYRLLNGDERNISLATVYRLLAQLVDVTLLSSAVFGESRMVYELNKGKPHDHIVCTECGQIEEFFDPEIEARQKAIAETHDFALTARQFVLFGVCPACRKAGA
ncbi:Fur family transcriptional regulator [Paraburkholderia xenovorans]|uniref:Fur family transcriptional regulator n=1 Tax=Paraburkholderia xenovorans TaxID=36873 RepID=UPI0038B88D27